MKKTKAKTRKILIIFIVLILLTSTSAFLYASSVIDDPIEITFQDGNLYQAIKSQFAGKSMKYTANDTTLTLTASEEELNQLEELNLKGTDGVEISNITGLEKFVNLKKINLSNNNITDITPITQLANLLSINLSNNSNINIYDKGSNTCYLPNQSSLEELYLSNTNNSNISFVSKLPNLKILELSNNGISSLTELQTLNNLEILDLSNNAAIKSIDDIIPVTSIKELNISTTGITSLFHSKYDEATYKYGIFSLRNLVNLNIGNNELSIEPISETYTNSNDEEVPYLSKLEKLNFNYTGNSSVDFSSLSVLTNLTHLYMKGNQIQDISDDITSLSNLKYIDLSENNIEKIDGFIKYEEENVITATLSATQINLENNKIQDITPLGRLGHDITYLDLSSNIIFFNIDAIERYSLNEGLDLTNQGQVKTSEDGEEEFYGMFIKEKTAKVDQYIILPSLFQNSKNSTSKLYANNITFTYENIRLNPDTKYQEPGKYNVIIEQPEVIESDEEDDEEEVVQQKTLSITLNGGCADGSILRFQFTTDDSAVDSILFEDPKLASAISSELRSKITEGEEYYIAQAEDILNITNELISSTTTLNLQEKDIFSLLGLSSFENLISVNLSNNRISSIDELKYCENMEELYVSNNSNIGNNYSAIENMTKLVKLDLSNIGMTNIQSIQNLITKWQEEEEEKPLKFLNISNNSLESIKNIGILTTLESLYISNIGISDISEIKTLTDLKTLNISGNGIERIDILKGLSNLKYLYINNNNIEDITPISQISLDTLDFSTNKVKDVSSLTKVYTTINMDSNKISDISNFEGKLIQNFSAKNQKISKVIYSDETENITIELPAIFKSSKQSGSKVYSATPFEVVNCELTSDGNSIVINPNELGEESATVKIADGNAAYTTASFKIKELESDQIISDKVTVVEQELTIKDIAPKTTVANLKSMLLAEMEYDIVDKNGTTISETTAVGTGCKIKMANGTKEYVIIVTGDTTGDGAADFKDILAINKHRLNKTNLTKEYLTAGDVNEDENVDFKDILQINKFRLGKINEL